VWALLRPSIVSCHCPRSLEIDSSGFGVVCLRAQFLKLILLGLIAPEPIGAGNIAKNKKIAFQ